MRITVVLTRVPNRPLRVVTMVVFPPKLPLLLKRFPLLLQLPLPFLRGALFRRWPASAETQKHRTRAKARKRFMVVFLSGTGVGQSIREQPTFGSGERFARFLPARRSRHSESRVSGRHMVEDGVAGRLVERVPLAVVLCMAGDAASAENSGWRAGDGCNGVESSGQSSATSPCCRLSVDAGYVLVANDSHEFSGHLPNGNSLR